MVSAISQPQPAPTKHEQAVKADQRPDIHRDSAAASPSTPPADKPTLSPPPPDTPIEGSTPTSSASEHTNGVDTSINANVMNSSNYVSGTSVENGSSANGTQQSSVAQAAGDATLSASAPTFVPNAAAQPFVPASLSASNGYQNGEEYGQNAYNDASGYGHGYNGYENYGVYANGYSNYSYCMTSDGLFVPQQADSAWAGVQPPPQPPAKGRRYPPGMPSASPGYTGESDALVAVLQEQFPLYNQDSLTDVLKVNAFDLASALDMLAQLESEQTGQRKQYLQAPPSLDEDNFPSLAGSPAPSVNGSTAASGASPVVNGHAAAGTASPESSLAGSPRDSAPAESSSTPRAAAKISPAPAPPTAWDNAASGYAHKAAAAAKASNGERAWKTAEPQPQQGASKLQADAANFRPKSKGTAKAPWVETGAAVSGQYADAREEARDHARLRNMYFQQATQAYLVGNKALAKELGAKGREHSDQMKAAHAAASENIFQQRNPRTAASAVQNRNGLILLDLHGLHVSEALKIMSREISQLQQGNGKGRVPIRVQILVGTGHHTKGSRTPARLPVAVETFLQGEGLKYTKPDPGLLQISL